MNNINGFFFTTKDIYLLIFKHFVPKYSSFFDANIMPSKSSIPEKPALLWLRKFIWNSSIGILNLFISIILAYDIWRPYNIAKKQIKHFEWVVFVIDKHEASLASFIVNIMILLIMKWNLFPVFSFNAQSLKFSDIFTCLHNFFVYKWSVCKLFDLLFNALIDKEMLIIKAWVHWSFVMT